MPSLTAALRDEYEGLFNRCVIAPSRAKLVGGLVNKLLSNRGRYEAVSKATGVPWHFIAVIHNMESSQGFRGHLHNGDPLTANDFLYSFRRALTPTLGSEYKDALYPVRNAEAYYRGMFGGRVTSWAPTSWFRRSSLAVMFRSRPGTAKAGAAIAKLPARAMTTSMRRNAGPLKQAETVIPTCIRAVKCAGNEAR